MRRCSLLINAVKMMDSMDRSYRIIDTDFNSSTPTFSVEIDGKTKIMEVGIMEGSI